MKYITSPKSSFLLEAPLEVLHSESLEWLEEIEFLKDETAFFYALIVKKTKQDPSVFKIKEAKDVEKHLIYVSAEKIDDLKMEVQAHERFLARLLDNPKLNEQLYRSRHKVITEKIHSFEYEFKKMKRKVFLLAEKASGKKKALSI
ncbi:MAG: hypothetical protein EPN85_00505 [Bacteroidetes bacterium]|nr:MAG: hypothetical protein EPN85_00505 [Bacteroidota bacterium]